MRYIIIFLTLITLVSYGQDKASHATASDKPRIQVGVHISPDICFRTLKNNNDSLHSDFIITERNRRETVKVGFTAGLTVCFNFKRFAGFEAGIHYSKKGYQTREQTYGQSFYNPIPERVKLIFNYHYVDIPMKINFMFGKKNVRFITSAGMTANFLVKDTQTNKVVYPDHTERTKGATNNDFKDFNVSPTVSIGIDFKINNQRNFRIEPEFRYGILKIIDTPVTGYLYSAGLNLGYYF